MLLGLLFYAINSLPAPVKADSTSSNLLCNISINFEMNL